MIKLVKNEMIKMFFRKSIWVMLSFVILAAGISSIYSYKTLPETAENWRSAYEQRIELSRETLKSSYLPEYQKKELEKSIKLDEYVLENDFPVDPSLWEQVEQNSALIAVLAIFAAAAAARLAAGEFSQGTIKYLLIRPVSRSKVLLSKYLAVMLFGLILAASLLAVSFLVNGVLFGFHGPLKPYLCIGPEGNVIETGMIYKTMESYILKSTAIVMYAAFAFMLAVVFRTTSLAQGITIVAIILGPQAANAFAHYPWAKYLLFAHTDPTLVLAGNPFGVSLMFCTVILALYFLGFNLVSWLTFTKRDVL